MRPTRSLRLVLVVVLCLISSVLGEPAAASARQPGSESGFRAHAGPAAAKVRLPRDVRLVSRVELVGTGLTIERYQQFATRHDVPVDGAQLTVTRREGKVVMVVGAHFPRINARNRPTLGSQRAIGRAAADQRLERGRGERGDRRDDQHGKQHAGAEVQPEEISRTASLMLDPDTGRLFYRVEAQAMGLRQFHAVDAETGEVLDAFDALAHDRGTGVKRDRKSLVGGPGTADNLTRREGSWWRMRSVDGRLVTYDMARAWSGTPTIARDDDNRWTLASQRAAVDAHYYARASDDFLRSAFGFDVLSAACGYGQIRSVVRFGKSYANAFWNGKQLVYGDGDAYFRPLSGAQDVVTHELAHAVTECTSKLVYWNEPGALNEAFSDIIATAAEFALSEPLASNCRREPGQAGCPDWWIGEDVWRGGGGLGIRNMAVPAAGAQPSHYANRYKGTGDNGGVHINSGIPNHAFYLLSQGGRNARCAGSHDLQPDCEVLVPGVGLADAQQIAFVAYSALPSSAKFCDARVATVAAAQALHPGSLLHAAAADLSWKAVGVADCAGTPRDFTIELLQRALYLAPKRSGQLQFELRRGTASGPIEFSVEGLPAGWAELEPTLSSGPADETVTLALTVPDGVPSGMHAFRLRATSGSRSAALYGLLVVDATPPTVSPPSASIPRGVQVSSSGSQLPLSVDWNSYDSGSGLAEARLEWSVDGGSWQDITPPGGPGVPASVAAGPGSHRFRVRATDGTGNSATSDASQPVSLTGWQENSATYSAGWSAQLSPASWGSQRSTKEAKRRAEFRFTGSDVAWVAERGPKRGKAKVFIDGVLVGRVDLYAANSRPRTVVFSASGLSSGAHTLRIVALGTSGRPSVGVDGFLVLSRR